MSRMFDFPDTPWTRYIAGNATAGEIAHYLDTKNWVIARRSKRIVEKYGADVVCLTPSAYRNMKESIVRNRPIKVFEALCAGRHYDTGEIVAEVLTGRDYGAQQTQGG